MTDIRENWGSAWKNTMKMKPPETKALISKQLLPNNILPFAQWGICTNFVSFLHFFHASCTLAKNKIPYICIYWHMNYDQDILHMVVWIETKQRCSRSPNVQILFSACFSISLVTVPYQQSLSHILTKIHYIEKSQQKTNWC